MRSFRLFLAAILGSGLGVISCATTPPDEDSGAPDAGGEAGLNCGTSAKCGVGAMAKCVDVTKDPQNCGACGTKCAGTQFCAGSKCSDQCNTPFKLCGQFCVNLDTDHENCGTCGKGCTPDQDCIGKACVKKCGLGLTPCGDTCANLVTDHDFCGDCNTACGMNEICSGSQCCGASETSCLGQCVDVQFNNDNCGQCGFACGGNTPFCVKGKCSTCNPSVLLLMDQDGAQADNQKLAQALTGLGIPNTLINNGIESYSGSPAATTFGAVLVSAGDDYFMNNDMPNAGQASIVAAQQKGTGVVFIEPMKYNNIDQSYLATLAPLFLVTGSSEDDFYSDGPPYPSLTKTVNHAVWNGVTAPLNLNPVYDLYTIQGGIASGASAIAQCTSQYTSGSPCTGVGTILVKSTGGGRIVHFNATINDSAFYTNGDWASNADIIKLMTNAIQWTSNCP